MMILLLVSILSLHHLIVPLESAFVNISLSHTNITVNGSLEVTLLGADPNKTSSTLVCSTITSGGAKYDIVFYNFFTKTLVLENPMPADYVGRVKIISHQKFAVSPIKFSEEKLGVQCKLTYFDNAGTRFNLKSSKVTIENVYALPVISGNQVQILKAIEGEPKEVTCSVKSRPASTITWSSDTGVAGIPGTPTVQTDGFYSITTGRYNLSNPAYTMDGKKITCTGIPVFGSAVTTVTTLDVSYRPKNTMLTVSPSILTLNNNVQLTCSAIGKPNVTNYKFFINGKSVGNTTDGKLTLNASYCANYTGKYTCVPENSIGEGEKKTMMKEFDVILISKFSSKSIDEGQSEVFTCSATGCSVPTIRWTKDGARLMQAGNILSLLSVNKSDAGRYACHASNGKYSKSAFMTLKVNYQPDMVTFTTPTLKPVNGNDVVFTCNSNGLPAPSYRILRINGSNETVVQNDSSSTYTIPNINYADYIDYKVAFKCVPYNRLGDGPSKNHTLYIQVQPMLVISSNQTVKDGETVTLSCNITTANPPANITWRTPSNSIISHTNGAVTINSIKREQAGSYSCHADNGVLGAVMKTTHVVVQHAPVESKLSASHKDVNENRKVTLTCTAVAVPAATYQFYQMNNGNKDILHSSSASGVIEVTVLHNANPNGYNNTYGCKAMNPLGNGTEQQIVVNILVKPTGISSSPNVTVHRVNESSKVDIKCSVSASSPSAQFKWTKSGSVTFAKTSAMLSFATVKRKDAGKYTCNASNALGYVIKEIDLVVQYGPDITNGQSITYQKCLTSSVTITCEAIGNPHPFVQIIFAGNSKKNGTGSAVYTINSIQVADLGNYICMAKNALKEVSAARVLQKIAHPGAVTGVKLVKATEKSIEISWGMPTIQCIGSIKEIRVEYKEVPAGNINSKVVSGISTKAIIDGLTAGKEYEITVIVVDRTDEQKRSSPLLKASTSTKASTPGKTTSNFESATYGLVALSIISIIAVVALVLLFFKMRKAMANLKVENEALRKGAKTSSDYMELIPGTRDNAGQEYEQIRNFCANNNDRNHGVVNAAFAEISSKDSHGVEQPYMEISKPYEVMNTSM